MVLSKCFWQWFLVYFHLLGPWCRGLEHTWDKCNCTLLSVSSVSSGSTQCRLSIQPVHWQLSSSRKFLTMLATQDLGCSSGRRMRQCGSCSPSHTWQISSYGTDRCTGLVMNRQSWSQALPPTSRITKRRVRLLTKFMSPPPSFSWECNEMSHVKDAAYVSQWTVVLVPLLIVIQNERKLSEQGYYPSIFHMNETLETKSKGLL